MPPILGDCGCGCGGGDILLAQFVHTLHGWRGFAAGGSGNFRTGAVECVYGVPEPRYLTCRKVVERTGWLPESSDDTWTVNQWTGAGTGPYSPSPDYLPLGPYGITVVSLTVITDTPTCCEFEAVWYFTSPDYMSPGEHLTSHVTMTLSDENTYTDFIARCVALYEGFTTTQMLAIGLVFAGALNMTAVNACLAAMVVATTLTADEKTAVAAVLNASGASGYLAVQSTLAGLVPTPLTTEKAAAVLGALVAWGEPGGLSIKGIYDVEWGGIIGRSSLSVGGVEFGILNRLIAYKADGTIENFSTMGSDIDLLSSDQAPTNETTSYSCNFVCVDVANAPQVWLGVKYLTNFSARYNAASHELCSKAVTPCEVMSPWYRGNDAPAFWDAVGATCVPSTLPGPWVGLESEWGTGQFLHPL